MNDKTASHKQINNPSTQPTSLYNLQDQVTKHRKPRGYYENPTYSISTIVNRLLLTEDNGLVSLRKDKTNDGDNEIVKVCSNRTKITKEHKIIIIGNTHSRVCAMRKKNYLNNKFEVNGLVKPSTGVYIVLNSTIKDTVNLTKSYVIVFVVVSMVWV